VLLPAGKNNTYASIDEKYFGMNRQEVYVFLQHYQLFVRNKLSSIIVNNLWERV